MVAIRVTVDDAEVVQALQGMQHRLTHLAPVLEDVRERMEKSIDRNFSAGGRPTAWLISQRARRENGKTLQDHGHLRSSITGRVEGTSVVLGTNVVYARIHQLGGTVQVPEIRPKHAKALRFTIGGKTVFARRVRAHAVHMPARPFLVAQEADIAYIRRAIQDYIAGA